MTDATEKQREYQARLRATPKGKEYNQKYARAKRIATAKLIAQHKREYNELLNMARYELGLY